MVFRDMERWADSSVNSEICRQGERGPARGRRGLGCAFGAIAPLVTDIITPLSLATNNVDFSKWGLVIRGEGTEATTGAYVPPLVVGYGHLIQSTLNFLVVGLSIFLIFKLMQGVIQRFRSGRPGTADPARFQRRKLLSEIRDVLREQSQAKKTP